MTNNEDSIAQIQRPRLPTVSYTYQLLHLTNRRTRVLKMKTFCHKDPSEVSEHSVDEFGTLVETALVERSVGLCAMLVQSIGMNSYTNILNWPLAVFPDTASLSFLPSACLLPKIMW